MCVFCREAKTHVVRVLSCVERAGGEGPEGRGRGAESLLCAVARAKIEQWPVRELHTTHTTRQGHRHRHRHRRRHTLRSPQLPREVGRREPDGVRWWGPTQPAPALQRLVLSRRRRSLSKSVALLPVPGATSASLVARALPEGGRGKGGEDEDVTERGLPGRWWAGRGCTLNGRVAGRPSILRRKSAPPPPPGSPRVTSQPTP